MLDEQIMAALERKDRTQSALIAAVKANLGHVISEQNYER